MSIDASPQEVLEAIFAAADSDDATKGENCPTVGEKKA